MKVTRIKKCKSGRFIKGKEYFLIATEEDGKYFRVKDERGEEVRARAKHFQVDEEEQARIEDAMYHACHCGGPVRILLHDGTELVGEPDTFCSFVDEDDGFASITVPNDSLPYQVIPSWGIRAIEELEPERLDAGRCGGAGKEERILCEKLVLHLPRVFWDGEALLPAEYGPAEAELLAAMEAEGLGGYVTEAEGHYGGRTYPERLLTIFCADAAQAVRMIGTFRAAAAKHQAELRQEAYAYELGGELHVFYAEG